MQRFKVIPAVYLILEKDNKILLLRRFNTGWQDGNYSLPSGHLEGDEKATEAMVREAKEEIGIKINLNDLKLVHVSHRKSSDSERIDLFFTTNEWTGKEQNMEEDKCDHLDWFPLDSLPENIVPNVKIALDNYLIGNSYSEIGFED